MVSAHIERADHSTTGDRYDSTCKPLWYKESVRCSTAITRDPKSFYTVLRYINSDYYEGCNPRDKVHINHNGSVLSFSQNDARHVKLKDLPPYVTSYFTLSYNRKSLTAKWKRTKDEEKTKRIPEAERL